MRPDIVVTRADNTCVRLHLHEQHLRSMRSEAIPIEGNLDDSLAILVVKGSASAASTSVPQRAACLDAATSDDAASAAPVAATTCAPQRSSDAAAAAAICSTKPALPAQGRLVTDDAASPAAGNKTSVPQRSQDMAARPDAAASDDAVRSAATAQRAGEAAAACFMTERRSIPGEIHEII